MTNLMEVRRVALCTSRVLSLISMPYSKNVNDRKTLSNLIFEGRVVAAS